mmetsp:Transcript_8514/g.12752  ORF Transcript_8514/g.12752 Transcript_8514/m.12752 type:complete len:87 (-) Transcript_8514:1-261(-)
MDSKYNSLLVLGFDTGAVVLYNMRLRINTCAMACLPGPVSYLGFTADTDYIVVASTKVLRTYALESNPVPAQLKPLQPQSELFPNC